MKKIIIFAAALLLFVGAVFAVNEFDYNEISFKNSGSRISVEFQNPDRTYVEIPISYNPDTKLMALSKSTHASAGDCDNLILMEGRSCIGDVERVSLLIVNPDDSYHIVEISNFKLNGNEVEISLKDKTDGRAYEDIKSVMEPDSTFNVLTSAYTSSNRHVPNNWRWKARAPGLNFTLNYDAEESRLTAVDIESPEYARPEIHLNGYGTPKGYVSFLNNEGKKVKIPLFADYEDGNIYFDDDEPSSCNGRLLFEGDSCEAVSTQELEGVMLYAYKGRAIHELEIKNVNSDSSLDIKDVIYGKNYEDIQIRRGEIRLNGLGRLKITLTGTEITANSLRFRGN